MPIVLLVIPLALLDRRPWPPMDTALALGAATMLVYMFVWRAQLGASESEVAGDAERAVRAAPGSIPVLMRVADTWDQLGGYDRARGGYEAVLALEPEHERAHLGLAVQIARLGDLEQLDDHLARAGELARGVHARMRIAIALAARGESARAEEMLRGILRERPDFGGARRVLASLLEQTGRAAEAEGLRAGASR